MFRIFISYISAITLITAVIYYAGAQEHSGFREKMIRFLEKEGQRSDSADEKKTSSNVYLPSDRNNENFFRSGEWSEYVSVPEYNEHLARFREGNIFSYDRINVNASGSVKVNVSYGKSYFTSSKYVQYDEDKPVSRVIESGFQPEQTILLHMDGTIGDRITVFIDHDSRREDNHYLMNYRSTSEDEVIKEINAGEIDIKFNHSKYAVYDNSDAKGLGVDFTIGKGDFTLKAFGSVARGESVVEYFKGNSSPGGTRISEYQYIRGTYYQLEPFRRYDSVTSIPVTAVAYNSITVKSNPSNPSTYTTTPVNISSSGFELYIDDQNQYNNYNAIKLSLDGGYYTKMVNGSDYSINYSTGVIHFLKEFPESSRIFAVYNRSGGTLDPYALSPADPKHPGGIFSGKIFVFIKYGYSIDEDVDRDFVLDNGVDRNNDGKINIDIYEIRSVYFLGAKNIIASDFSLNFYDENQVMTSSDKKKLTGYKLELTSGTISFYTREPFRPLISADKAYKIYSEAKRTDAYIYSRYRMMSQYNVEAKSFKLKHTNIIEKSVRIKINEREIPSSRFSVDYETGYVLFTDSSYPVISSDSRIEIKYEYLPYGTKNETFIGGVRADYDINKSLRVGGSFLISKDGTTEAIPDIGNESEQTLLFEGDASLKLSQKRLADLYNIFAERKKKIIPAEFSAYAEYAKSIKDTNTFGKALIDNMESSESVLSISTSEKDWILSSMPRLSATPGDSYYSQDVRGLLNYYFYRNPNSPDTLLLEGVYSYKIDYSKKPGPFNVAGGHIDNYIVEQTSQKSLVFDYNFLTDREVVTAVTRKLSDTAVDLSGMQYVEVWVKYEGGAGDSVDLWMDIGSIDEDSDKDGILDTEDANRNGYIDSEPSSGYSEDRGYSFNGKNFTIVGAGAGLNSSTLGDGVLTSEDINGNGVLDSLENVYTVNLGTISQNGGIWQKIKVPVDTLSASEIQALQETTGIRVYLKKNSGVTGRVFIDSIKCVSSNWKNPELDAAAVDNYNNIKISLVNSIDDSDYKKESFLLRELGVYKSLYGGDSTDDIATESETALQIDYNIPGLNKSVSISRKFSKVIDIRYYKTLNLWINARSIDPSNVIGLIVGSSDSDYMEYKFTPAYPKTWEQVTLKLSDDSSGAVAVSGITGNPDLKRIKYIKAVVYGPGTTGRIWLNEIYVSESEKLEGDAHWYEMELKTLKPLFKTASGVPVFSDMNLRYITKGHSSQFSSINKTSSDMKENYHEVFSSAKILPYWNASFDYINESSSTDSLNEEVPDSKKGDARRNFVTVNTEFNSPGDSIPSITFGYSFDKNENLKEASTDGIRYNEETVNEVQTPVITYRQEFSDFLYGKLSLKMMIDMAFSHSRINRDSLVADEEILSSDVSLKETEKKQESDAKMEFDYNNTLFYIHPRLNSGSKEIVEAQGSDNYDETGVNGTVRGNFYFPFSRNEDLKYMERNNGTGAVVGIKFFNYFLPEYSIDIDYKENGFKDFKDELAINNGFNRFKNSMSNLTTGIKLPILLNKTEILKKVTNMQFNYQRSVYFDETDVPYEGESTDFFSEKYGISKILSGLSSSVYNLFKYYPGYYFRGRGNFGKGRDMVYDIFNDDYNIKDISSTGDYNNSLKLIDKFTADFSVDLDIIKFYYTGSLNQVCERSNIYGIPNQVVSADGGVNFEFDLMRILGFGFFRKNGEGLPYHSSLLNLGLNYTDSKLITYNIHEKKVSPSIELILKWDRSSLGFKYELDYRKRNDKDYININLNEWDSDYIYLENMEGTNEFSEKDMGHKFSSIYETDVGWIYSFFSKFYKLTGIPIFSIEYKMERDRYDYFNSVSPEPYDLYMVTSELKLDLHKNVQGGIKGKVALENFRNRENEGVSKQVRSYEISASISIIF